MGGTLAAVLVTAGVLGAGQTALLDFGASWCGPCRQMEPIVRQLEAAGVPIQRIDIDEHPELAKQYRIEGVPTFVMLVDGQEVNRLVGAASLEDLQQLAAAGADSAPDLRGQLAETARGVVPAVKTAASALGAATIGRIRDLAPWRSASEAAPGSAPAAGPAAAPPPVSPGQWSATPSAAPLAESSVVVEAPTAPVSPSSAAGEAPQVAPEQLVSVAARLKVNDASGHSYGTGTVIDSRGDEALVLTCGHVFRDSQGQGPVTVDLFGPGAPQGLVGEVVSYDLERDLGIVRIRPGRPVPAARVAPPGYLPAVGHTAVSVGCDHGADPSAVVTRVTALDKYLGPPNIEAAGLPVEGRSGGGLFSTEGYLIGVCNAADPQDNEGLYSALGAIHQQLEVAGLSELTNPGGFPSFAPVQLASAPPERPTRLAPLGTPPAEAVPVDLTAGADPSATVATAGLTAQELAVLENLRAASPGAEVVCVVRSLEDPRARSEIIVLDRASPAFLEQLAAERRTQDARHLTAAHHSRGNSPLPPVAARPAAGSWQR